MGLTAQVAIVPDGVRISPSELTSVASALSKQVSRDFAPIRGVDATVDGFATLADVPTDYWPIMIMANVQGAAGYHDDKNGQPYAVVQFDKDWSLTASHECLEMLADPYGSRVKAGNMLDQAISVGAPDHRVNYLVEVSDPCESGKFAYQVNGVLVSDFITPNFYDPMASSGVRYSFTGAVRAPRTILDEGYISWQDPKTDKWMQLTLFDGQAKLVDLSSNGKFMALLKTGSPRSAVDAVTVPPKYSSGMSGRLMAAANGWTDAIRAGQEARAAALRAEVAGLNKSLKPTAVATRRGARKPRKK